MADLPGARPHPDEIFELVASTPVETMEEAEALNAAVLAATRPAPMARPPAAVPSVCSREDCENVAVLQAARECSGCAASERHGDPHTHPVFYCSEHPATEDD